MRKSLFFLLFFLIFSNVAIAGITADVGKRKDMQNMKEKTQMVEKNKQQRQAKTKREEQRREQTIREAIQKIARQALSARENTQMKITISVPELFYPIIAELEKEKEPFSVCKLVTFPPTLEEVGIAFEHDGVIDLTLKQYLESKAVGDGIVSLDEEGVKEITNCALDYSLILGSAIIKLNKLYNKSNIQSWLGVKDLKKYARIAILNSIEKPEEGVKETIDIAKKAFSFPCRLWKNIDTLQCGGVTLVLHPNFQISLGRQILYGDRFLFNSEWTVSTAFSLDQTWEKIKTIAKDDAKIRSWAKTIEKMEAEGEIKKAALTKKHVIQMIAEGRYGVNLNPFNFR
ncbi:MAG: hypothetical protein Q9M37_05965 [Desulfonauticus sp.]|nr:hypothetical protein [Desulfonauticus sp.]